MMYRHFPFCVSLCFFVVYSSGCAFFTLSEDPGGIRLFWSLLLTLLGLAGAGVGATFLGRQRQSNPHSQDTPFSDKSPSPEMSSDPTQTSASEDDSKSSIKKHIKRVLDKAIEDYDKKVLAYYIVREAERRDSLNTLIKKLYEVYGEVYSLPYFEIPEELFSLKGDYILVDEYLYAYLEKQGVSPNRQKHPKPQLQTYTEQRISSQAATELDQFCSSFSQE